MPFCSEAINELQRCIKHQFLPRLEMYEYAIFVKTKMLAVIDRVHADRYRALMNFLSNVLREDGGFEYKKAIVDSILILIKDIPDAKEPGLGHLCEFIEACSVALLCGINSKTYICPTAHMSSSHACTHVICHNSASPTLLWLVICSGSHRLSPSLHLQQSRAGRVGTPDRIKDV